MDEYRQQTLDLPRRVAIVNHQLATRLDASLAAHSLTVRQFAVLDSLAREPGIAAAELARRSLVTRQTINGLLRHLESIGAVTKSGVRQGRTQGLILTDRGVALHAEATQLASSVAQSVLSNVPPLHRAQLYRNRCEGPLRGRRAIVDL